eukprot:3941942-Rhodomonas_salina.3
MAYVCAMLLPGYTRVLCCYQGTDIAYACATLLPGGSVLLLLQGTFRDTAYACATRCPLLT